MAQFSNMNIECDRRFGHCDGHTDMTYDSDGKHILTCGIDSEVRLWSVDDADADPQSFQIDVPANGIVCNNERFFIASEANAVKSFTIENGESEMITLRFTTNVNCIDMSDNGNLIIAGAGDFTIKSVNLTDGNQKTFEGHDAPILSVALDPKHKLMASSSCDGSVRIWTIEEQKCIQFWTNHHTKSNDFINSSTLCRICWKRTDGQSIAIPKNDEVIVYDRESWKIIHSYKHENFKNISIVSYSYDGNRIAAANTSGTVIIWETQTANPNPVAIFQNNDSNITCLKWNPKNHKQLCFTDISGNFGVMTIKAVNITNNSGLMTHKTITLEECRDMFGDLSDDDFIDESDKFEAKIEKTNKNEELPIIDFNSRHTKERDANKSNTKETQFEKSENDAIDHFGNDDNEYDIGAIKSQYEQKIIEIDNEDYPQSDVRPDSRTGHVSKDREPQRPVPMIQQAFQPSSTPIHFQQRFMIWNSVGIVLCYNTETDNSIDVEFHDKTIHHSIHIPNVQNYIIADLSTDALILATNGDNENRQSRLFCMLLSIWDATKEWHCDLPQNELIEAIILGSGFIAIATDQRFIRIFTTGGIQTHIFSIPGPVLCLASHEQLLMVIYHLGSGIPEEQSLGMLLMKIDHKRNIFKQLTPHAIIVSVSPKSPIYWSGFTDEGTPCIVDFAGIVRLYKDHSWIPIASTKEDSKDKSDNYFIIGMSELQCQIRCLYCKRGRYPDTVPRPTMMLLPFKIPLCELYTSKGKYEEEQIRHKMLGNLLKKLENDGFEIDTLMEESNKKVIESLIKIFALALGAERESLALEIAYLLPNQRAVAGAIKYAHSKRHTTLAQKLTEVAHEKAEYELRENHESDDDNDFINPIPAKESIIHSYNDRNDDVQLKPKSMKNNSYNTAVNSNVTNEDSDSDVEMVTETVTRSAEPLPIKVKKYENTNDSSDSLKPKKIEVSTKTANPFKVANNTKSDTKRSKRYDISENEESDDDNMDEQMFEIFYEEMREQIQEDNSDIEEEEQLMSLAKKHFNSLESKLKKRFKEKVMRNSKKRKTKPEKVEKNKKSKSNDNTISSFFKKTVQ